MKGKMIRSSAFFTFATKLLNQLCFLFGLNLSAVLPILFAAKPKRILFSLNSIHAIFLATVSFTDFALSFLSRRQTAIRGKLSPGMVGLLFSSLIIVYPLGGNGLTAITDFNTIFEQELFYGPCRVAPKLLHDPTIRALFLCVPGHEGLSIAFNHSEVITSVDAN
jgi:hypothetical protein